MMNQVRLDCFGCAKEKLIDVESIYALLDAFPAKLGLTKTQPPAVFRVESGVSGVVLFAQSHLAVHTYPDKEQVSINIFSSDELDTSLVRSELLGFFDAAEHQSQTTSRDLQYVS
jgi:S-adenosylmethionine decarboxylase